MIGASVDNIRTCSCNEDCENVVVEYKCPWKHRNITAKEAFVTPEIDGKVEDNIFSLRTTASYYFQVQLQMFVCMNSIGGVTCFLCFVLGTFSKINKCNKNPLPKIYM
jgi:hypothetical protein